MIAILAIVSERKRDLRSASMHSDRLLLHAGTPRLEPLRSRRCWPTTAIGLREMAFYILDYPRYVPTGRHFFRSSSEDAGNRGSYALGSFRISGHPDLQPTELLDALHGSAESRVCFLEDQELHSPEAPTALAAAVLRGLVGRTEESRSISIPETQGALPS